MFLTSSYGVFISFDQQMIKLRETGYGMCKLAQVKAKLNDSFVFDAKFYAYRSVRQRLIYLYSRSKIWKFIMRNID